MDWIQDNIILSVIVIPAIVTATITYGFYRLGFVQRASVKHEIAKEARESKRIDKDLKKARRSDAEIRTIADAVTNRAEFNSYLILHTQRSTILAIVGAALIGFGMSGTVLYSVLKALDESGLRELPTADTILVIALTVMTWSLVYVSFFKSERIRMKLRRQIRLASYLRNAVDAGFCLDEASIEDIRNAIDEARIEEALNAIDAAPTIEAVENDADSDAPPEAES